LACAGDVPERRSELLLKAATAVELLHAASLLHDDIVDAADTRRHRPAMHRVAGARATSLDGWYLGQLALTLVADLPYQARRRFGEAGQAMSRGQLTEIVRARDTALSPDERLAIMLQKTGAIFGVACELAGILTEASDAERLSLRGLGEAFGMLFQIADDVDDLFADASELGRLPGADLATGVISLLDTFALQSHARAEAVDVLTAGSGERDLAGAVERSRALMRSSGALHAAYDVASRYAESAREYTRVVRVDADRQWFRSLTDATLARVRRHVDAAH
jgi:heptaprenyl diphosphate synthase